MSPGVSHAAASLSQKSLMPQKWVFGSLRLIRLLGLSAHICERLSLSPAVKGLLQKSLMPQKQVRPDRT